MAKISDPAALFQSISDPSRLRLLRLLSSGELNVQEMVRITGLSQPRVSKHLSILKQAWLVECRKVGRWIYYQLSDKNAPEDVEGALNWLKEALKKDKQVEEDKKRLGDILKIDPEDLCKKQSQNQC